MLKQGGDRLGARHDAPHSIGIERFGNKPSVFIVQKWLERVQDRRVIVFKEGSDGATTRPNVPVF